MQVARVAAPFASEKLARDWARVNVPDYDSCTVIEVEHVNNEVHDAVS
jgi:hypothetical protein